MSRCGRGLAATRPIRRRLPRNSANQRPWNKATSMKINKQTRLNWKVSDTFTLYYYLLNKSENKAGKYKCELQELRRFVPRLGRLQVLKINLLRRLRKKKLYFVSYHQEIYQRLSLVECFCAMDFNLNFNCTYLITGSICTTTTKSTQLNTYV